MCVCVCVCVCENFNSLTNNIIGGETSNILWYFLRTCTVALGQFPD